MTNDKLSDAIQHYIEVERYEDMSENHKVSGAGCASFRGEPCDCKVNDKVRKLAREIANKFAGSPSWAEEPIERIIREALRPLLGAAEGIDDYHIAFEGTEKGQDWLAPRLTRLRDELAGWKGEL